MGFDRSDANPYDFSDKNIAQYQTGDADHDKFAAHRIMHQGTEILRRHDHEAPQSGDWKDGQNRRGESSVRADCLDLTFQTEALADNVREAAENFAEVAAGLPLEQHGGREEAHVSKRNALAEVGEGTIERPAHVLFIEKSAKLLTERISELLAHHLEADSKRTAGAHGAREEIQRVRQLRLHAVQTFCAGLFHHHEWHI